MNIRYDPGPVRESMPLGSWLIRQGFDDAAPFGLPRHAGLAQVRAFTAAHSEYFDFTDAELEGLYAIYCDEAGKPTAETLFGEQSAADGLDAAAAPVEGGRR